MFLRAAACMCSIALAARRNCASSRARATNRPIVPLPPVCDVREMVHQSGDQVLLNIGTYTAPAAWYSYQPGDQKLHETKLRRKPPANFDDIEVKRVFAKSRDGTQVPMTIMYPRGTKLDGTAPALLYGYGGYGISMTPSFDASHRICSITAAFMPSPISAAAASMAKHGTPPPCARAGNTPTTIFYACAKLLVDEHYTNPNRLAIEGASNGGLLMGVALTQHPELFRAVVSHVGIYDMLRSELSANGTFNIPSLAR